MAHLLYGRAAGDATEVSLPQPNLPMAVSPVALGEREWLAGGKSPVVTPGPSAPRDGWLLPTSQLKYHLFVRWSIDQLPAIVGNADRSLRSTGTITSDGVAVIRFSAGIGPRAGAGARIS